MYLIGFPLLIIPFAIYNMIAFLTPGVNWTDKVPTIHLVSGQDWTVTPEDLLLGFSMFQILRGRWGDRADEPAGRS